MVCFLLVSSSSTLVLLRGPKENAELAEMVLDRLNAHKADNPSMGEVGHYISLLCSGLTNQTLYMLKDLSVQM